MTTKQKNRVPAIKKRGTNDWSGAGTQSKKGITIKMVKNKKNKTPVIKKMVLMKTNVGPTIHRMWRVERSNLLIKLITRFMVESNF